MKIYFLFVLFIPFFAACTHKNTEADSNITKLESDIYLNAAIDTTPRVTGIGGIFFVSDNPKETNNWYRDNLGLVTDDYGSVFEFRNANNPHETNYLRWSTFDSGGTYLQPSKKEFMINYRVVNIESLIRKLSKNGVKILDSIETYEYGKFVHVMDNDGNKIELWEPVDSVLRKLGGKTTK